MTSASRTLPPCCPASNRATKRLKVLKKLFCQYGWDVWLGDAYVTFDRIDQKWPLIASFEVKLVPSIGFCGVAIT